MMCEEIFCMLCGVLIKDMGYKCATQPKLNKGLQPGTKTILYFFSKKTGS